MHFSSTLKITGLNDYITPDQECKKPIHIQKDLSQKVQIHFDENTNIFKEIFDDGSSQNLDQIKISLTDCLACSGCVTTAEAVLVDSQGIDHFMDLVQGNHTIVISFSPQARASLAYYYKCSQEEIHSKLVSVFKEMGIRFVFDNSFSRDIALYETALEFLEKKKSGEQLPLLTGSCPGWICYAEKRYGNVLPNISKVKSPQQIMGSLVKNVVSQQLEVPSSQICHVAIMTCYDKKLEASRKDFEDSEGVKDVDSVLVTSELVQIIDRLGVDMSTVPFSEIDDFNMMYNNIGDDGKFFGMPGVSDGFCEYVFRHAAKEMFGLDIESVEFQKKRNKDFKFTELKFNGKTVLKFATAYGLRNIENVVRMIKLGRCDYDFVEIMACPGGCTNGAGQIKDDSPDLLQKVDSVYSEIRPSLPMNNPRLEALYSQGNIPKNQFYTEYHEVEKSQETFHTEW
eukprot:TRINITY_DN213_c0_g1_i1.p1 TRINITY_DN213_c0_g1~~TRINITY_DN213_c0_g1_i1.p1  ORF type:complete len:455 (+),score=101.33 TRINITY_DN213_c0_g1_i1:60-1424(+)